jgi:Ethanolamine utilization protein EutJ (predicted chaperonin)
VVSDPIHHEVTVDQVDLVKSRHVGSAILDILRDAGLPVAVTLSDPSPDQVMQMLHEAVVSVGGAQMVIDCHWDGSFTFRWMSRNIEEL